MKRAGITASIVAALAAFFLVVTPNVSSGAYEQPWVNDMNQETFWETLFSTPERTVTCTKYENHGGFIPAEYDAAVIKDGSSVVKVYDDLTSTGAFTATGAINPSTGQPYGAPHSWVLKCKFHPVETTTTTTTLPETTTTTLPETTTTTTLPETTTTTLPETTTTTIPGETTTTVPSITYELLGPVCVNDFPFIRWVITGTGIAPDATATITLSNASGVVATYPNQPLSGQIIWPGASVDPPDWPGWRQNAAGVWIEDPTDAVLREPLTVTAEVNPTAVGEVAYPPATEACADPDNPPGPPTTPPSGLPATGGATGAQALIASLLVLSGGAVVAATRRRA